MPALRGEMRLFNIFFTRQSTSSFLCVLVRFLIWALSKITVSRPQSVKAGRACEDHFSKTWQQNRVDKSTDSVSDRFIQNLSSTSNPGKVHNLQFLYKQVSIHKELKMESDIYLCSWNSLSKNTGVGCLDLPDPGIHPPSLILKADSIRATREAPYK